MEIRVKRIGRSDFVVEAPSLHEAYLEGADLTVADLREAYLHGAAYLTRANLRWADLRMADLTGGRSSRGRSDRGHDNRGEVRSNDWYQRPVDLGVLDNEYRKTARQRRLVHKFRVRSEQQRIATLADERASR